MLEQWKTSETSQNFSVLVAMLLTISLFLCAVYIYGATQNVRPARYDVSKWVIQYPTHNQKSCMLVNRSPVIWWPVIKLIISSTCYNQYVNCHRWIASQQVIAQLCNHLHQFLWLISLSDLGLSVRSSCNQTWEMIGRGGSSRILWLKQTAVPPVDYLCRHCVDTAVDGSGGSSATVVGKREREQPEGVQIW